MMSVDITDSSLLGGGETLDPHPVMNNSPTTHTMSLTAIRLFKDLAEYNHDSQTGLMYFQQCQT